MRSTRAIPRGGHLAYKTRRFGVQIHSAGPDRPSGKYETIGRIPEASIARAPLGHKFTRGEFAGADVFLEFISYPAERFTAKLAFLVSNHLAEMRSQRQIGDQILKERQRTWRVQVRAANVHTARRDWRQHWFGGLTTNRE